MTVPFGTHGLERFLSEPFFIVGTQRSGTTLLCRMLSSHPKVYVKNELGGLQRIFREHDGAGITAAVSAALTATRVGRSLGELYHDEGVRAWGLKDPGLSYVLALIPDRFPRARVVFIVRDGRAVARSYKKARWGLGCNAFSAAQRWAEEVRMQDAFVARHPERSHRIRYEDLLADPEAALRGVCRFLGLPFHDSLLRYYEHPTEIDDHALTRNVFRPPDPELATRWRTELSARAVRAFESVAAPVLAQHGYDLLTDGRPLPRALRLYYHAHQAVMGEIELQYQLRIRPHLQRLRRA